MANTVKITKLVDGPRHVVVHVYLASDGSGNEADTVLVDASAMTPSWTGKNGTLECVWGSFAAGMDAILEWDGSTDQPFLHLPANTDFFYDFRGIGGLPNNCTAGATGDLTITTRGFTAAATDVGFLTLKVKKD